MTKDTDIDLEAKAKAEYALIEAAEAKQAAELHAAEQDEEL